MLKNMITISFFISDKLLQQRSEDAAALRLKTDRVQTMPDEQVVLLRADIKVIMMKNLIFLK